ncbi:Ig-like domain-containing protein [Suttonella sp. R2A3]|uniref:Ig-like domain-containing protein n=1 Tax=Suttonella sp. R2A3 TaxID=2908648 RepID=UPI001F1E2D42|nr:Ig-like domain-containing protein [Suttonella sp. R2A3]UJF25363.1 Ig-like domain-containing protein [Suttonella sp. R2A3]
MNKIITLNINRGKNTLETLQINTAGSEAVRIAAQNGVNYELIDAATQFAPENLTVLRQGDDLLIAFEGSLINEPDLIIEDYYQQSKDNPLIGLNEDGQYYAYVPEAGADVNALTMLAEQIPSGQALGGDALFQGTPLWPLVLVPLAFFLYFDDDRDTDVNTTNTDTTSDTIAPDKPTIHVADDGKSISGTAEPGSTVKIDTNGDGVPDYSTTADSEGNYTVAISGDRLINGETATATATDAAGNKSDPASDTAPDITAPDAPTINIADNGKSISGKAEPGSTVTIDVDNDGTPEYTTTADSKGNYTVNTSNHPLTNGETVSATATDAAGNKSGPATDVANDTTAPDKPTIHIADDGKLILGTAEPGSTVKIDTDGDGVPDYSTTADSEGNYTVNTSGHPLINGETATATATDAAGNKSDPASDTAPDTTAPDTPTINIADNGKSISGKAEPGSTVKIDTDGDGVPDYSTTADSEGEYTIAILGDPLTNGETATATATDAAGNKSGPATDVANDTTAPDKPTIHVTDNGKSISGTAEPGSTVKIDTDGDGVPDYSTTADSEGNYTVDTSGHPLINGETATATATDAAGNKSDPASDTAPDTTAPDTPTINIADNGKSISGKAEPGSTVKIDTDGDGVPDYSTTADSEGEYTIAILGDPLINGETATATATDAAGNKSGPATDVANDTTPPNAPKVTPNSENGSVAVAPPADPDLASYTVTYVDESDSEQNITVIKQPDGSWLSDDPSITPKADGSITIPQASVKDGSTVKAVAIDKSGNDSEEATGVAGANTHLEEITINMDINDDGYISKSEYISNETSVTIDLGTELAGETISLSVNGSVVREYKITEADYAKGYVTLTGVSVLTDVKTLNVSASITKDASGNPITDPDQVTDSAIVDLTPPAVPTMKLPEDATNDTGSDVTDNITNNTAPKLMGTGDAGDSIRVEISGETLTTTVAGDGTWSVAPTMLADGDYSIDGATIKVTATDAAGNKTLGSNTSIESFTVDSAAPVFTSSQTGADVKESTTGDVVYTAAVTDKHTYTYSLTGADAANFSIDSATGEVTQTVAFDYEAPKNRYEFEVVATDVAGNRSSQTVSGAVTNVDLGEFSITDASATEGESLTFTVTRNGDTSQAASVNYTTGFASDDTADASDIVAASGTLNFAADETSKTITIATNQESKIELSETFTVTLSDPSGDMTIGTSTAKGTIINDDALVLNILDADDTFGSQVSPNIGSNTDNYTRKPTVHVEGIPRGASWEYNLNDGSGWKTGSGRSFKLPGYDGWEGKAYHLEARLTSPDYDPAVTTGTLDMTLDQKIRDVVVNGYDSDTNTLLGIAEADAFVYDDENNNGKFDVGEANTTASSDGTFSLALKKPLTDPIYNALASEPYDKIQARLGIIDKAGNETDVGEFGNLYYFTWLLNGFDWLEGSTQTGSAAVRVHNLSDFSEVVLVKGNVSAGTYNFNGGDDSMYVSNTLDGDSRIFMGDGDDYFQANIATTGGTIIDMGAGDDTARFTRESLDYLEAGADLYMGTGNDTLIINTKRYAEGSVADGGEGIDTYKFDDGVSGLFEYLQDNNDLTGFEIFDITGGGDNRLIIEDAGAFTRNSGTFTDDNGNTYNSAMMVKGNAGDSVDFYGSTTATGTTTFGGVSYDIYSDGTNDLLVLSHSGIQII